MKILDNLKKRNLIRSHSVPNKRKESKNIMRINLGK
jgi:hypothetical protein